MVGDEVGDIDGLTEVVTLGEEFGRLVIGLFSDDVEDGLAMVGNLEGDVDVVFNFDGGLVGELVGESVTMNDV